MRRVLEIRPLLGANIPAVLQTIPSPPTQLFVQGPLSGLLELPRLSVVGSRKPTPYGKHVTQQLIGEVARLGVVIVSGLALGIDSLAHQACVDADGQTIAVLPSGLDYIYPASHQPLADQILLQGGALVTEYSPNTPAYKLNFIERNRLVSGLGNAVLIIEAAENSGTLHTANFALNQGKTVLIVPGNITSPLSIGTNRLLNAGATPVTCAQDIVLALGLTATAHGPPKINAANPEEAIILGLLQKGLSDSGQLLAESELNAAVFNQTLSMLEITGKIRPLGAGHWAMS